MRVPDRPDKVYLIVDDAEPLDGDNEIFVSRDAADALAEPDGFIPTRVEEFTLIWPDQKQPTATDGEE